MMLKSLKGIKLMGLGLLGLALLGTLVTFLLSPTIIAMLTDSGFSGAAPSLQILSWGFPAYFLSTLLMWVLVTKGRYKTLLFIYTMGLLINIFLNFTFIPQYSFYAAAYITVISEYLILLMQGVILLFERR